MMVRAIMSVSRLILLPGFALLSVVSARVVGMSATVKRFAETLTEARVRLMPSIVIEPLGMRYGIILGVVCMVRRDSSGVCLKSAIVPTASTCPCTKWPPSGESGVSDGSRLTLSAGFSELSVLRSSVSRMTSKVR